MTLELRKVIDELALPLDLPWSAELSRRDYHGALTKIEEYLQTAPDDLKARLWWVQCQAEVGAVPATALSSPLEEIYPRLKEENSLFESGISAFLRVSLKLLERKQTKLSALLLERAYDFAIRGRSLSLESREAIRTELVATLKNERERAELKRESKNYLENIERKIGEFAAKEESAPGRSEPPPRKPTMKLSAKSIMESAIAERAESDVPPELVAAVQQEEKTKNTRQAVLITILGSLMIILGVLFSKVFVSPEIAPEERFVVNRLPSGFPALSLPELSFSETDANASLEDVSKRLEKMKKDAPADAPLKWSEPTAAPTPAPTVMSQEEKKKLPEMDPSRLAGAVVESLGSSPARNPVPNVLRGVDGRVYGPPPTDPNARTLDGGQLQPVEVQQLKEPQYYRIVASTSVFSAPSVVAESVARLERDAKVQVVAKMGKWLELRSSGGRRGYIYAQDAIPQVRNEK